MDSKYDIQMMVQVATMYYLDGLTQEKIASQLGISRSYISMILSEARDLGIVEINIKNPLKSNNKLAKELSDRFGLEKCYVIPTSVNSIKALTKIAATQGAAIAEKEIKSHSTIGVAWGSTCYEFMTAFSNNSSLFDVNVVPLIGGSHRLSSEYQLNEMVRMFAEKLQGTPSFIYAPALAETNEDKDLYMKSMYMNSIVDRWENLDVAIISVGAPPEYYSSKRVFDPMVNKQLYEDSKERSVGDICARRFNLSGEFVANAYNEKVMGVEEQSLRKAKKVLCIAAGNHKTLSIIGALRSGLITHFISDENTVESVIKVLNS